MVLITDPFSPSFPYDLGRPLAHIATVSHAHPGHNYIQGIRGKPKIIQRPGEYEIGGVFIIGFAAFHDRERGRKRGKNTLYLIEMDGLRLCHLGDLGHPISLEQIGVAGIDILMIPVGGFSTLNPSSSAELVRVLEPRVVLPMHYRTEVWGKDLEPVDKFLKEMGIKETTPQPKLSLSKSRLPQETQVILLSLAR